MKFRKCHLFFSCGTMKFFLFLLFLLLLFDSPQGSTISLKRSIRALNTTLETNFNGTYERRNPCNNAEIETTSYVASHEFRHRTEENNWSDYTHKCSSIISSFLQSLGNLVHFNHKQNGIFNFHINTSISQKQDDRCEPGHRTSYDTLPTITIEATDYELSPKLPSESLPCEQLSQDENKERKNAIREDSLNEEIYRRNEIALKKAPRTPNFNQFSAINTPEYSAENQMTPVPSLDATIAEGGTKLPETKNVWTLGDIFLPTTETVTSLEPEFPTAGTLMGTKNSPQAIIDSSESTQMSCQTEQYSDFFKPSVTLTSQLDPENYALSQRAESRTLIDPKKLKIKGSESFNEPSSSKTSYFCQETTPQPIADEESLYPNQFSDLPLREQSSTTYSEQLFDDNLDRQVPDFKLLPNQERDNSFIFSDKIPKTLFKPQELVAVETYEPKKTAFKTKSFSLQQQFPIVTEQNEKLFQQSLQNGKQPDNFEKIQILSNAGIPAETEITSFPTQTYLTKYEEASLNKITNAEPSQIPNFTPSERPFVDYDDQTPAVGFSENYLIPSAQMPSIKNTPENTVVDEDSNEAPKEKAQTVDYPDDFFEPQPLLESNLGSPTSVNIFSPNNDQDVRLSDNLPSFNIKKPVTDLPTLTSNGRSPTEKSVYDVNENQFLSTLSPKKPSLYFTKESPLLTPEIQKSVSYYSELNADDRSTDKVTDAELSLPSDQYESTARPESQALLNYPDQYDDVEEAKHIPESNSFDSLVPPDSDLTTDKPDLQFYSTSPENQASSFISSGERLFPLQYSTSTTSNQKFSSSYDSTSDYESSSPFKGETFSDEYLTTLPPEQDSFENSQHILTTFDPYQDQPRPALEEKLSSIFPGKNLNEDAMSPTPDPFTLSPEQSSSDIYTSRTPTSTSFDDYQDSLLSKPDTKPSFTTSTQYYNENTYEPTTEPYTTNNQKTYSEELQPTTPTIFSTDRLKQQSSSYFNQNSDLTLDQPLNYASDTPLPSQTFDIPKSQPLQFFEKHEDSRPDVEPFSDQQYNNFPTESSETETFMNSDSEIQLDSSAPQMKQYADDSVLISTQSKQNPDTTPYFSEDFPQENQTVISPQSFIQDNKERLFPDRPSFGETENPPSSDFSTTDDYFEPVTANNHPKPDLSVKFPKDSDARPEKFSAELFATPVPPFSFPAEDFSSPSNFKTILGNPLTQSQVEKSLTSLDQFEESALPFSAPFRDVNKIDSDFQTEKILKQPFEPATTEEEPTRSTTPVYEDQSDKPVSYSDATESFTSYAEKPYFPAMQPKIQTKFFPVQKPFPKFLTSDLQEYDSTIPPKYQPIEGPAEIDLKNYSDSDNSRSFPAVDQQMNETTDQESTLNYSNRFSDFELKNPSADFFPSAERSLNQNSPDIPKEYYLNNRQPSSVVLEPQSLISTADDDQSRSLEFQSSSNPELQPESILSSSDDKSIFSEKTPLDIPLQTSPLALVQNQELQSNDFQISDSSNPYSQPQVTSYTRYPFENYSKESQRSSVEDFVTPEPRSTKPETYRNMNRAADRQIATKFPQREPENYNQSPSSTLFQPTKFNDKEVVFNNDYSSSLKSTSPIEPSVHDYNKQIFDPYSGPNFTQKSQTYQYQPEPSPQISSEEYSDTTPTAEEEILFDIDRTTVPSVLEKTPSYVNEQSESQYVQEKISDYSSSLASENHLKPQPSFDYLSDLPGENIAEGTIRSAPQTSNFENIPFFEVKPDKTNDSYPFYTEAYEQDTAGIEFNQPETKEESDYSDELTNANSDVPTSDSNNSIQSSIAPPAPESVPDVQFRPNDFTSFPQSTSSVYYQLNNNSNEETQQNSDISLRYPSKSHSEKEISFITDNISPQPRPTTAVYNDEEITEIFPISKPQPQTSLNFADQFPDGNIPEQLPDSLDKQYQITPDAAIPTEFEPVPSMSFPFVFTQRNTSNFDSSDNDANNQPSFLVQPQTQKSDEMSGSFDQTQNDFHLKPLSQATDASPLYTAITTQSQSEPATVNPERPYNGEEQFSPYDRYGSQPIVDSNIQSVSVEYQEEPSIPSVVNDRFSSNTSPREQRYFNEAFPFPEAQSLIASKYGQQDLDSSEKFQAQPYLPDYPVDVPLKNVKRNMFPSTISRPSATQRFEPQLYPKNSPNQYPNYNERTRPNAPIRNFYNNELIRQANKASPQYFMNDVTQAENSFERSLPFNVDHYPKRSEVKLSPDQTIKNANSPFYDDNNQALSSQLPNEKLLDYDEDITSNLYAKNSQMAQAYRQLDRDMIEEDPREGSDDFLIEADSSLGFNRKADPYDIQSRSSFINEPPSFPSPPVEKEPHSNPLFQTLESHLTFPFHEHLHPSASYASSADSEKESLNDSFLFEPQNQNEFRYASDVPSYPEERDSELDFINYQRSQPLNGVDTTQNVTNTRQPDSQALVSDPNIPSNEPGEDCVSYFGQNPIPLLCPFDPILKGNMTAPSYYILISKLPVDHDKEEQFKVEKVYLGDGMPLNCTLSAGKTFPTSSYTPISFSATGAVKLQTKSDFA